MNTNIVFSTKNDFRLVDQRCDLNYHWAFATPYSNFSVCHCLAGCKLRHFPRFNFYIVIGTRLKTN